MAPFSSSASYPLLSFFFLCCSFIPSSYSEKLSFAPTQIKFWSENVENEMPAAISAKLSPLTKLDSDYYAKTVSQKTFKADIKFCSLAKLACSTSLDHIKIDEKPKTPIKVYNVYAGAATTSQEKIVPFSFFRKSNLKQGDTIHLSSLKESSISQRAFLPPQIASKLPLTLKGLTKLFPYTSKDAIETTLSYCSAAGIKGELKSCPKSLEEMISFSKTTLKASKLHALTSKSTEGSDKVVMIGKVKQFNVEKFVVCHEIFLPMAAYYCHSLPASQIYAVDVMEAATRTPVNTVLAVCHMDTSSWPEKHIVGYFSVIGLTLVYQYRYNNTLYKFGGAECTLI